MRTAISSLDLRRAASLDDALAILRDDPRTPIAGATDVYVALNFGTLVERRFLDIWALDELRAIEVHDGPGSSPGQAVLRIGALATYTDLIRSAEVNARLPMLVEAARLVGGVQIQNRGTLGGNLANASPAGDTLPVLLAAEATVVLRSAGGERRVAVTEFFTGYRATALRPDELIVAVEVRPVPGRQWFRKVGTRAAQAISKIVVAGVRGADDVRLAFGSVAATPVRARAAERALAGGDVDAAVAALGADVRSIDDVRSTAAYRATVAANLVRRFWRETELSS
jgi:CO/xanthine dehydrogenase FAD-binding subunit